VRTAHARYFRALSPLSDSLFAQRIPFSLRSAVCASAYWVARTFSCY